jgi:hypothetical protein
MNFGKWLIGFLIAAILVSLCLSWLFGVPCFYTLLGFLVWLFAGHLITVDDEEPGGWSNPEGSRKIWNSSLFELAAKAAVLVVAVLLLVLIPALHEVGAN